MSLQWQIFALIPIRSAIFLLRCCYGARTANLDIKPCDYMHDSAPARVLNADSIIYAKATKQICTANENIVLIYK